MGWKCQDAPSRDATFPPVALFPAIRIHLATVLTATVAHSDGSGVRSGPKCSRRKQPTIVHIEADAELSRWSMMMKSVLIADDHKMIRHALVDLFASQEDFEVCGEAENGRSEERR